MATKKMKPVKAWAIVNRTNPRIVTTYIFPKRSAYVLLRNDECWMGVEIRPLPSRKPTKRKKS